jgi:hypothetical protein
MDQSGLTNTDPDFASALTAGQSTSAAAVQAVDPQDISVDEYMANLMERLQRNLSTAAATRPSGEPARPASPARPDELSPSFRPSDARPSEPRRIVPVENATDRSAMRELANQNARQALEVHSRKRLVQVAWGKLILAIVATGASLAVVQITRLGSTVALVALLVCMGAATWWTCQFLRLTARRSSHPQVETKAEPPVAPAAPAASPAS